MKKHFQQTFRALHVYNFRLWSVGSLVSNIGTWMQRTAQDWLVLTQLTHHDATAVGITMGLQFGPQLLFLPWTGSAADRFNQRKILLLTQAILGLLSISLGILTITGVVTLWQVYAFAFASGTAAALDAPVRQTFVTELVGDDLLPNAVALNSTSFNAGGMIGPAVAGILIAHVGTGWAILVNGLSFGAVILSMLFFRRHELLPAKRAARTSGAFLEGLRYTWGRADLRAILIMLFLIGTFGFNFPVFIATMSVKVFRTDASGFGFLLSALAVGTVSGALAAAAREKPRFNTLVFGAALFGIACTAGALAPAYAAFAIALAVLGAAAITFSNATNSLMQLGTPPHMRGRVMALRIGIALGGTPIGAPFVGWVANHYGSRWSVGVGGAAGFVALLVGLQTMLQARKQTPLTSE